MKRGWWLWIGLPLAVAAAAIVFALGWRPARHTTFSVPAWAETGTDHGEAMARDLVRSGRRLGMDRDAISRLLGVPEEMSVDKMGYFVGQSLADIMLLEITLDGNGRVINAVIRQG